MEDYLRKREGEAAYSIIYIQLDNMRSIFLCIMFEIKQICSITVFVYKVILYIFYALVRSEIMLFIFAR